MSTIDHFVTFMDRLGHVHESRNGEYTAKCPAHDDRSPSLHFTLADDDRILIHCKAGCSANEICAALGLKISDLFPPRPENERHKPMSQQMRAAFLLRSVSYEVELAGVYLHAYLSGTQITENNYNRFLQAVERIHDAAEQIARSKYVH